MLITAQQSYELLAKHGVFAREICDKCGAVLGAVRFTRADESGAWCSRECRGDDERLVIRRGGRPRKHKTDAERQRAYRANFSVTKPPRRSTQIKDLQAQKSPHSTIPLTPLFPGLETPCGENGGSRV